MPYPHIPVMQQEVLDYLNCRPGKIYVDCTLGGAGHARRILENISPDGILIGIDQDVDAIENAKEMLKPYALNIRLFHGNFIQLPEFLARLKIPAAEGILLDLGISQHHLKESGRGFSFQGNEPLDMRMNIETKITAEDIVNSWPEGELRKIFKAYGEERRARQIAHKIIAVRGNKRINTSKELVRIVCETVPKKAAVTQRIHPATRVFMALRIAVNRELERLDQFMNMVVDLLSPRGRLCALSYHSLEDRIVKHRIREMEKSCTCPPDFPKCVCKKKATVRNLTRKPKRPTKEEIAKNPMARSARLRAMEKH